MRAALALDNAQKKKNKERKKEKNRMKKSFFSRSVFSKKKFVILPHKLLYNII